MFQQITWQSFLAVTAIGSGLYYFFVLILFFRQEGHKGFWQLGKVIKAVGGKLKMRRKERQSGGEAKGSEELRTLVQELQKLDKSLPDIRAAGEDKKRQLESLKQMLKDSPLSKSGMLQKPLIVMIEKFLEDKYSLKAEGEESGLS